MSLMQGVVVGLLIEAEAVVITLLIFHLFGALW
jgi:hypothetical protein